MATASKFAPSKYRELKPTKAETLVQLKGFEMPDARHLASLSVGDEVQVAFINKEEVWLKIDRTGEEVLRYDTQMTLEERKAEEEKLYCRVVTNKPLKVDLLNGQRVLVYKDEVVGVRFADEGGDSDDDDDEY